MVSELVGLCPIAFYCCWHLPITLFPWQPSISDFTVLKSNCLFSKHSFTAFWFLFLFSWVWKGGISFLHLQRTYITRELKCCVCTYFPTVTPYSATTEHNLCGSEQKKSIPQRRKAFQEYSLTILKTKHLITHRKNSRVKWYFYF